MLVRAKGVTIRAPEGDVPPGGVVELDDGEATAMIRRGFAEPVEGPVAVFAPALADTADATGNLGAPPPAAPEPDPAAGDEAAKRQGDLIAAIELLDDDGFVKTGPRAGRPKAAAMASITGLADLSADEIDAAWDMRAAGL